MYKANYQLNINLGCFIFQAFFTHVCSTKNLFFSRFPCVSFGLSNSSKRISEVYYEKVKSLCLTKYHTMNMYPMLD